MLDIRREPRLTPSWVTTKYAKHTKRKKDDGWNRTRTYIPPTWRYSLHHMILGLFFRVVRVFRGQLVDVTASVVRSKSLYWFPGSRLGTSCVFSFVPFVSLSVILSIELLRCLSFLFFQEIGHVGNLLVTDKAGCFCSICCDHKSGWVRLDCISLY